MLMLVRAVGLDRPRFRLLLGAGLLLLLIDLALIGGKTSGAPLIVSGAAAVALAWFAALHPRWTTAAAGTATALSLAVTVLLNQTFHQPPPECWSTSVCCCSWRWYAAGRAPWGSPWPSRRWRWPPAC
ncbi:hypothetical protein [Allosalinactinospora lopnorensis]|uniref:hypothetical protein n=1 Tax=Allosalinactinospora lopnorensis TaxID=1352348 RepID=UPI0006969658|nr:hypothetical protein [Allosalinactinospora lopnorensis]